MIACQKWLERQTGYLGTSQPRHLSPQEAVVVLIFPPFLLSSPLDWALLGLVHSTFELSYTFILLLYCRVPCKIANHEVVYSLRCWLAVGFGYGRYSQDAFEEDPPNRTTSGFTRPIILFLPIRSC